MTKRKVKTGQLVKAITDIRVRNNILWMQLLGIALEKDAKKARKIMREIVKNDREISEWMSRV